MEKRPSSDAGFLCSFEPPGAAEWRALAQKASAASAFRVPGWIEAWAESYLPQGRWRGPCRNLSVRNERDELVAIFPLARMKFGPFEFRAAAGPYFPTRGIVLTNRESAAAACSAIANFLVDYTPWRLGLRIGPVSDRDTAISAFAAALQDRGWSICTRKLGNSMIVDVPVDKAAFEDRLGGIIKRATYYERRMRRIGEVRIAEIRPSESEQWASVVDDAAAIEQNSWIPRENGTRLLSGADNRRFWTQAVVDEVLRSSLTLWVLYFDGIPASFSLTLDAGEMKFILANLYDERVKAYSTGTVLTFYVISRAIDQRCRWIDWGLGDSGYKKRWLAIPGHGLHDLIAFPPGPIGWICQRIMLKRFGFRAHLNGTTL